MENGIKPSEHLLVLDSGRSLIKAKNSQRESVMDHALIRLSEIDFKNLNARQSEGDSQIMRINGVPYAFGKAAASKGFTPRQYSSERYTKEYYGIIAAAMFFRCYEVSVPNAILYGSHAPEDIEYRQDLINAALGEWTVECCGRKSTYNIVEARAFDEPVGGAMNCIIREEGRGLKNKAIQQGTALVFDIGGQTVDVAPLDFGKVVYKELKSSVGGIIEVEESFIDIFKSAYRNQLKGTAFLDPDRIRNAIRTNSIKAGGLGVIDVTEMVNQATANLVSQVANLFNRYGGIVNYEYVILTGGGGGLLETRIKERLNNKEISERLEREYVILADKPEDVHKANIRGGYKMFKLFENARKV